MAREIRAVSPSGTLYARIINSSGLWWNGTTFEAYAAANYGNYDIALTEQGASQTYVGDFPSAITTGGTYEYFVHRQAGASPAEGDVVINTGKIDWSGSAVVTVTSSSMTGADFYAYVLRRGFKRTDKSTEFYEACTDAVQEMRRRFMFDEAEAEAESADQISTLGDFKLTNETDMGLLLGVVLEDSDVGTILEKVSKKEFDELYPFINVDTSFRGYPKHFCVYAGSIYIGPIPDSVSYNYRISYSKRAGTISSSTTVPFTDVYRDVLSDLVLSIMYEDLEEFEKSNFYRQKFEGGFTLAVRRDRQNSGIGTFNMKTVDF